MSDGPKLEITAFGDTEPRYAYMDCDCPGPRCPFCHSRIDKPSPTTDAGQCPNRDCFMWCLPVPIPETA